MDVKGSYLVTASVCTVASVLLESEGPMKVLDYGLLGAAFVLVVLSVRSSETANRS